MNTTRLRELAEEARMQIAAYASGARPISAVPADLGHIYRRARTDVLAYAFGRVEDLHDVLSAVESALADAWIVSGRQWELHLGMDGAPDAQYLGGGPDRPHLSWEACTCTTTPADWYEEG